MNKDQLSKITCEQIYHIWVTDPDMISLFDMRAKHEFEAAHIPGSRYIDLNDLTVELDKIGQKLAVIIAHQGQEKTISENIANYDNYAFLSECSRWVDLKHPLHGEGILKTQQLFKHLLSKGDSVNKEIIFHQLFEPESSTYTYIIADSKTKEAAIIDPVLETVDRDIKLIEELGLKLIYALDTHIHADHITGAGELRKRLGIKTAVSANAGISCVDISLDDGQELLLGNKTIKVIATPGHTDTCMTFAFEGMIFTGDALLIRTCGRTDFQQGDAAKLYNSVKEKLFRLPDETIIYPGHDYRGLTSSTIEAEKKFNSRLNETISLDGFKKIMAELKLPHPKKIHLAVPANLACGKPQDNRIMHPQVVDGIPEVTVEDVFNHVKDAKENKIKYIDVRRPDEYTGELGHVDGAELITLGPDLSAYLEKADRNQEIVFICRSGGRSGSATAESIKLGYKSTINMTGGMLRWNEKNLPVVKDEGK